MTWPYCIIALPNATRPSCEAKSNADLSNFRLVKPTLLIADRVNEEPSVATLRAVKSKEKSDAVSL